MLLLIKRSKEKITGPNLAKPQKRIAFEIILPTWQIQRKDHTIIKISSGD